MDKDNSRPTKVLFEKVYPAPNLALHMFYYKEKRTDGVRKVQYTSELHFKEDVDYEKYDYVTGFYCMKCGEFHEYVDRDFYETYQYKRLCKCNTKLKDMYVFNVNGDGRHVKDINYSMSRAFPHRLTISEKGKNILVNATFKNWYFNAKAIKPFSERYSVRIIINTETGQSYYVTPKKNGKPVFSPMDFIRNATFSFSCEVTDTNRVFFKEDTEAVTALRKALGRHTDFCNDAEDLEDAINRLYLGDLYTTFPVHEDYHRSYRAGADIEAYRQLRRRFKKDSASFPRYLYWGCSKVAKKSIRKILYKYPEQKWTLRLLYKELGITNIDILRSVLSDREHPAKGVALFLNRPYDVVDKEYIENFLAQCKVSGMTDREKITFLFTGDDFYLRDAARLQSIHNLPAEEIASCKTVKEFHDKLNELKFRKENPVLWKRYDKPIEYPDSINKLEGACGNAMFTIIRRPWDLDELAGKGRAHNCVWSYKEDVVRRHSIIVEMTMGGKTAACIELDGKGNKCYQAFAPCNSELEGEAAEAFKAWSEKYQIIMEGSGWARGARYYVPVEFGYEPGIPF